jgi:exonuclease SbcC
MRIESVQLSDIKSYDDSGTEIEFTEGVNAVVGQNGAGKSTVQEAIGFALFDHLSVSSQDSFVRNGESSGWVRVTFVSNKDGRRYTVERYAGRSRHRIIDAGTNEVLDFSGKEGRVRWLKEHLGVHETTDLDTVWKSSVGVPQNEFVDDFERTPAQREDVFDPLLELDVYDEVSSTSKSRPDLLAVKKSLEGRG